MPVRPSLRQTTGEPGQRDGGAGGDPLIRNLHLGEAATEVSDDSVQAFIGEEDVGAEPEEKEGRSQVSDDRQQLTERPLVGHLDQHLRRAADAKGAVRSQGLAGRERETGQTLQSGNQARHGIPRADDAVAGKIRAGKSVLNGWRLETVRDPAVPITRDRI